VPGAPAAAMLYRARAGRDARSRGRSWPVSQAQLTPSAIRAFWCPRPRLGVPRSPSSQALSSQEHDLCPDHISMRCGGTASGSSWSHAAGGVTPWWNGRVLGPCRRAVRRGIL